MTEKEKLLRYLNREPCDDVPEYIAIGPSSKTIEKLECPICERPHVHSGYDVFGVHWTETEWSCHYTNGQKPIYEDIEAWREGVRIPNVEKFDWERCRADAEKFDRENKACVVTLYVGPFERTTVLTSFEDCLINAISSPEDFADLIGAIADYKIKIIKKLAKIAHPEIYVLHDDWGSNQSTLMSPDLWRQVIKPHTKRMYDAIHGVGGIVVQHSDGNIGSLVPDMIEMGAKAWHGQPECNNFPKLMAKYGDQLAFIGRPSSVNRGLPPSSEKYPGFDQVPEFLYEGCH